MVPGRGFLEWPNQKTVCYLGFYVSIVFIFKIQNVAAT